MRKVLIVAALALSTLTVALLNSNPASASTQVFGFLFRPTGTDGLTPPVLDCGWHDNCDGNYNDPYKVGLDWKWMGGSTSTRLRMRLIGPSTPTYVAYGTLVNDTGPCPYLELTFRRITDGAYYAVVHQQHANGVSGANYYWVAGPSYTYDLSTGTMVSPQNDACNGNDLHVMQWSYLVNGNILTKNTTDIPNEIDCHYPSCNRIYYVWTPAECIFGWSGPP